MNAVTTEPEPRTNVRTTEEAPEPGPQEAPRRRRGLKRGLLLGLITGFTGGTLFAPEAGEELRRRVRGEAEAVLAHPEELPSRLRERV
ncbi:MAG TPA: YtxH domain-containing protein, partial [Dehalococcoidia bacterium]|nr:YtxH domain-containing protein [Dehalococcoidia bacterium]